MWTPITKPTGTPYTNTNTQGKEQYDQASLTYDDSNTFYDGANMLAWTDLAKPTGNSAVTITVGMATGLLIPFTYSKSYQITSSPWTSINKPT